MLVAGASRSRRARVRFVVPTSTRRAPERASTSGMRKPSPISISSPRETSTSRPSASAASASSIAPALLLTTIARLRAGQPAQDRGDVILARAARAFVEVVLEIRVAAAPPRATRSSAAAGERRAAEVRVHDHAGRVQDAAQRGRRAAASSLLQPRAEVARVGAGADLLPRRGEHLPRRVDRERVVGCSRASSSTDGRSRSSTAARYSIARPADRCFTVGGEAWARFSSRSSLVVLAAVGAAVARAICSSDGAAKPGVTCSGSTSAARAAPRSSATLARVVDASGDDPRRRALLPRPARLARLGRRPRDRDARARCRLGGGARRAAARRRRAGARAAPAARPTCCARSRRAEPRAGLGDGRRFEGTTVGRRHRRATGCELDRAALLAAARRRRELDRRAVLATCGPRSSTRRRAAPASTARVAARSARSRSTTTARGSGRSRRSQLARALRIKARKHRFAVAFDPEALARARASARSASGSCARTTRSSPSPASACASCRRARAATSIRRSSPRRSPRRRTATARRARSSSAARQPDLTTAEGERARHPRRSSSRTRRRWASRRRTASTTCT